MKRSKAAKRPRKAGKKKRIKPNKEAATTFIPVATPNIVDSPVPAAPDPEPLTLAPDQSKLPFHIGPRIHPRSSGLEL
jgi:hypothetical protein